MLVIVNLSSEDLPLSTDVLSAVDAALAAKGLRKQVRSIVVPGKEYATTYNAQTIEKKQVEDIVAPLTKPHHVAFAVDIEESVSFP